jgi:predicted ester cyclase
VIVASKPGLHRLDADLSARYRSYIECLNSRDWPHLGLHVRDNVVYNDEMVGLSRYRNMLQRDTSEIPDLSFRPVLLVVQPPYVAVRLEFDCSPRGRFLDLDVMGRRVSFTENVFYRYQDVRIAQVWSIIDKAAVERQLQGP